MEPDNRNSDHPRPIESDDGTKRIELTRDRLSELPDLPLVHILSHMYFEDAVRTSMLSKRFKSLWTSVDSLNFSDDHCGKNGAVFVSFVDTALGFHLRREIDKFSVRCKYNSDYKYSVHEWIEFAAQKQVKSLHLNLIRNNLRNRLLSAEFGYKLPKFLYNNAKLVELVTCFCRFSPKATINWSALKLLCMTKTKLNESLISRILCGCNVLETLELRDWTGFDKLKINSPSLRVLRIVGEQCPNYMIQLQDDILLEIAGPNLVSLEVSGSLYRTNVRVSDVGSLMYAVMTFEIKPYVGGAKGALRVQKIAREVLESLCLVKALTVGGWFIQVLSTFEAYNLSSPWSERRSLTLCVPVWKWDHLGLVSLLHSSPYLEILLIRLSYCSNMCVLEHTSSSRDSSVEDYYWKSWRTTSKCPLMYLKTVKLVGFQVSCRSIKPLFQFLEFLLGNAKVLEEIIIQTSRYVTREALDEAAKLLAVPTASPDAVVQFEPPHLWIDPLCMYQKPVPF